MNPASSITGFRLRVLIGMMLVVGVVTGSVLYVMQRKVAADAERADRATYESELAATLRVHELRRAALTERCHALVRRPRIHAALEDNALDLLYSSARDEMLDVLTPPDEAASTFTLHATFYRFLDANGAVITPPPDEDVGKLTPEEEARLTLKELPVSPQVGYLARADRADEIVVSPIISTETNEVIAAIVLGFKPVVRETARARSGIWLEGRLFASGLEADQCEAVSAQLRGVVGSKPSTEVRVGGELHRAFFTLLNPNSAFPPAYEVSCFSLAESLAQQQRLRWQVLGAGLLMLLGAGAASHVIAGRLSRPVEQLAVDSARNVVRREQAEAALELTSVELERSMRFSADTSHQLKTPITVLRAGLEELKQRPEMTETAREEVGALIYQTAKISSMIHDLLLLSRLDAGRLQLDMARVDLTQLIDSLADDLSAIPSAPDFDVEVDVPRDMQVLGEKRYISMILQNLIENAWKYNRPGGTIAINAHEEGGMLALRVGNTGPGIPADAQEHIFERFHRGSMGENVPGHGLGLNIARELALLHGGDLRLLSSDHEWTEFEVAFRNATIPSPTT